jgi:adenosylcobinamide-phosphate synthase
MSYRCFVFHHRASALLSKIMFASLALTAFVIEALAGYPQWLFRAAGHPVTWIGALLAWCEHRWNRTNLTFALRRVQGIAALILALLAALAVSGALSLVLSSFFPALPGTLLGGILASALLAQRSLAEHVQAVADALETGGLDAGRDAVSLIVGRDKNTLDEAGVGRAAIESLAENFSDGVVAPLFWLILAGLPGAALYKTTNTADSMIGHKTDRYLAFGCAAARTDDLANLPASRLAALWIVIAALVTPKASALAAIEAVRRDAHRHRSPNAGWPEAAMAGALGLKLGGPRVYSGATVEDHWMGHGRAAVTAFDIRAALRLYRTACIAQGATVGAIAAVTLVL